MTKDEAGKAMDAAMDKIRRLNAELDEAEREWSEARDRLVLAERARMIGQSP